MYKQNKIITVSEHFLIEIFFIFKRGKPNTAKLYSDDDEYKRVNLKMIRIAYVIINRYFEILNSSRSFLHSNYENTMHAVTTLTVNGI